MKKSISFIGLMAILAIIGFVWCSTPAHAVEQLLTFKADSVTVLKDKNGADYVRIIMSETKSANGISYKSSAPINAYREMVSEAMKIKPGDTVTCMADKNEYQGKTFYRVLGFKSAVAKK
jgi:hypothetical protein